jgi:hypothetical protein
MDAEGNVLAKPGRSVEAFATTKKEAEHLLALRAKGDQGTPAEQKELLLTELKLGLLKRDEIQPRADKLTLSPEEKAMVAGKLVDLEVAEILAKSRADGPEKTGAALAKLLADGKTPSDDNTMFWNTVLRHASTTKDGDLAQRAFDVLSKRPGMPERQRAALQKLLDDAKAK